MCDSSIRMIISERYLSPQDGRAISADVVETCRRAQRKTADDRSREERELHQRLSHYKNKTLREMVPLTDDFV